MQKIILNEKITEIFHTPESEGEHFFGYYDKSPLNASGTLLLSHRVSFETSRLVKKGDTADIILWDIKEKTSQKLATTKTFNFQQGAMLQWLGPNFNNRIIYNDFRENKYVSIILNIKSNKETILPLPIYSISNDGNFAVCVNFERHFWCRPAYNYAMGGDEKFKKSISEDDGIHLMNLKTKKNNLIISTKQMVDFNHVSSMETGDNYLEHLMFSPNGERFFFIHRWRTVDGGIFGRGYTAKRDGSDIRLLNDTGDISHNTWQDNINILLFGTEGAGINSLRKSKGITKYLIKPLRPLFKTLIRPGSFLEKRILAFHYFIVDAMTGKTKKMAQNQIRVNGHPSFDPNNSNLFLSDTYQNKKNMQELYTYNINSGVKTNIGFFYTPPTHTDTGFRCDLHPRWDRAGKHVCIDSLHSGKREMYIYSITNL